MVVFSPWLFSRNIFYKYSFSLFIFSTVNFIISKKARKCPWMHAVYYMYMWFFLARADNVLSLFVVNIITVHRTNRHIKNGLKPWSPYTTTFITWHGWVCTVHLLDLVPRVSSNHHTYAAYFFVFQRKSVISDSQVIHTMSLYCLVPGCLIFHFVFLFFFVW